MNKHLIWGITLVLITTIVCGTLIYLNNHPYIFEIGDNALEGLKSINWSSLNK